VWGKRRRKQDSQVVSEEEARLEQLRRQRTGQLGWAATARLLQDSNEERRRALEEREAGRLQ
jgi:hypothetical protein